VLFRSIMPKNPDVKKSFVFFVLDHPQYFISTA